LLADADGVDHRLRQQVRHLVEATGDLADEILRRAPDRSWPTPCVMNFPDVARPVTARPCPGVA